MKRYLRNFKTLSKEEMNKLMESKVCVVGCGGLGGYIIEMLARIGIGYITVIDNDTFDETNLNRQLLSHTKNLGMSKSEEARKRINLVNPYVNVKTINEMIDESNAKSILKGHDVVVDALDNIASRKIVQLTCTQLKIPMVHGAIAGFYGQVTTIFPEDNAFDYLYTDNKSNKGIEKELGNPSFTPALVASIEVAETIKILINRGELLKNKVLFIDLLNNCFDIVNFDSK